MSLKGRKMIRAAIVGLGRWGQNLVTSVRDSEAIRFTAANTRNGNTASAFCQANGLRWTGDFDDILRDPAIDAVVLATPHSLHADQVKRAAAEGKHVFVEKPFALNAADARTMIEAAASAGIILAVGFNRRFHPSMARMRATVKSGMLGTIVTINAEQTALHGMSMAADAWRVSPDEAPGGAMTAIGVHLIDGMIDLLGRVKEVNAIVSRRAAPLADDTTHLQLQFESGALGQVFCSTAAAPHYRFAAYGTGGFAEILGHPMATFRLMRTVPGDHHRPAEPEVTETPGFNMLTAELEAFAASIAAQRPFPTPLAEILHGVEVFEAILQSAKTERSVTLASVRY
jgi:predicted dehydrogenase